MAKSDIQMEDKRIEAYIKNLMRVMSRELEQVQKEIMQLENSKTEEARSKYEKLSNKTTEAMSMLEKAISEQEETRTIQEQVISKRQKVVSKQKLLIEVEGELTSSQEELQLCRRVLERKQQNMKLKEEINRRRLEMEIHLSKMTVKQLQHSLAEEQEVDKSEIQDKLICSKEELQLLRRVKEMTLQDMKMDDKIKLQTMKIEMNKLVKKVDQLQDEYDCVVKEHAVLVRKVQNKQKEVRHKQQEVRSMLNEVKRKLQIPIKVLCWNIDGKEGSEAGPRNCLVPAVVEWVYPDVLLLQQNKSDVIVRPCQSIKKYRAKRSVRIAESIVLYDQDEYEIMDEKEHPLLEGRTTPRTYLELIHNCLDDMQDETEILGERISFVALRRRENPKAPVMIFVSFHNTYKDTVKVKGDRAELFCNFLSKLHCWTADIGCVIVGGADLNYQLSDDFCKGLEEADVPQYDMTRRRIKKQKKEPKKIKKIDYFVVASDDTEASVKALDFIDTKEGDFLHPLMSNPIMEPGSAEPCTYTSADYDKSLDHDPLVCEIYEEDSKSEESSEQDSESEESDESASQDESGSSNSSR